MKVLPGKQILKILLLWMMVNLFTDFFFSFIILTFVIRYHHLGL